MSENVTTLIKYVDFLLSLFLLTLSDLMLHFSTYVGETQMKNIMQTWMKFCSGKAEKCEKLKRATAGVQGYKANPLQVQVKSCEIKMHKI